MSYTLIYVTLASARQSNGKKKCSKKITLPKITDKITKLIALIVRERERERRGKS
jgi:hypothetical protein